MTFKEELMEAVERFNTSHAPHSKVIIKDTEIPNLFLFTVEAGELYYGGGVISEKLGIKGFEQKIDEIYEYMMDMYKNHREENL